MVQIMCAEEILIKRGLRPELQGDRINIITAWKAVMNGRIAMAKRSREQCWSAFMSRGRRESEHTMMVYKVVVQENNKGIIMK